MSKRCYNPDCNNEITFNHLREANYSLSTEYISRLFNSPHTQFYCCKCFLEKTGMKSSDFQSYQNLEDFCDDEEEFFMIHRIQEEGDSD